MITRENYDFSPSEKDINISSIEFLIRKNEVCGCVWADENHEDSRNSLRIEFKDEKDFLILYKTVKKFYREYKIFCIKEKIKEKKHAT